LEKGYKNFGIPIIYEETLTENKKVVGLELKRLCPGAAAWTVSWFCQFDLTNGTINFFSAYCSNALVD